MEKYSRFRDEATGIAPFQAAKPNSAEFNIFQTVLIFLLSIVCTPLAFLALVLYFGLAQWLLPSFLSRIVLNYGVFFPLRIFYTSFVHEGERRASVRKRSVRRAVPGDLFLCNYVSPLDPLIFESHRTTHFAFPTSDNHFVRLSTLKALRHALTLKPISGPGSSLEKLSEASKLSGAVLVVFVEGTTSNGRGLLSIKQLGVRDIAGVESQVYPAAIRYTPATASSPTPSTLLGYLWSLSRASWWYMASIKAAGEPMAKGTITQDTVAKAIASMGRLRILGDRMNLTAKSEYAERSSNSSSK